MTDKQRCAWPKSELMLRYHDEEWGVPAHDDALLFEFLALSGAQAGLSWETILKRREGYRRAFENFDPQRVARFGKRQIDRLLKDEGIIRNRMKIESAIRNAKAVQKVREEFGSFDEYLWRFVEGRPVANKWKSLSQIPASTPLSDLVSKEMKARGFSFVGTTICYAFMQSVGIVNDHIVTCFRHRELKPL
jgi:DNA-3-methyladenine glycosylase I